jgi:hypothetical protein
MGIDVPALPYFEAGDPMGLFSKLEIMPWQALLEAVRTSRTTPGIEIILDSSALQATTLSSLRSSQNDGGGAEIALQGKLRDHLVQKAAKEGAWGLALRGLLPKEDYDWAGDGEPLFTL